MNKFSHKFHRKMIVLMAFAPFEIYDCKHSFMFRLFSQLTFSSTAEEMFIFSSFFSVVEMLISCISFLIVFYLFCRFVRLRIPAEVQVVDGQFGVHLSMQSMAQLAKRVEDAATKWPIRNIFIASCVSSRAENERKKKNANSHAATVRGARVVLCLRKWIILPI